jgi:tight adherence protein B
LVTVVGALPAASLAAGDVFVAIGISLLFFFAAVLGLSARDVKRLRNRIDAHVGVEAEAEERSLADMRAALTRIYGATERGLGGLGTWRKLSKVLERADAKLRPGQLFYLMLGSGFLLVFFLGVVGAPIILLLFLFPFGAMVPYVVFAIKASKRQKAFDEQLPQLLMTMAASVRVGHSFRQAMHAIEDEGRDPASKEFGRVLVESDLGRPLEQALQEMAERLASRNFEYVIQTVAIQREVGGSLAGLFDMVAETVRQRQQFAARVRGLTAQGRISAYILVAMPFVAVGVLAAVKTAYVTPLFTTSAGHIMLIIAMSGLTIGALILKKMVSFRLA